MGEGIKLPQRIINQHNLEPPSVWGFVGKKQSHRRGNEENFTEIGDSWTSVAIERHTKLFLTFELGNRGVKSATRFMHKIARATNPIRNSN